MPATPTVPINEPGQENRHERSRKRRSAAGSRKGSPRRKGTTDRSGSNATYSSAKRSTLQKQYEELLNEVRETYPSTTIWRESGGLWLRTESGVLTNLGKKATFLLGLPYSQDVRVRAWGFWTTAVSWQWIGPRHTNGDGSICAFDISDNDWSPGESITKLLDLYTMWAIRQLYLEIFRRWPGYQCAHYIFERLTELTDNDYCGCGSRENRYIDCCKAADLTADLFAAKELFARDIGLNRQPPEFVKPVIQNLKSPPSISSLGS